MRPNVCGAVAPGMGGRDLADRLVCLLAPHGGNRHRSVSTGIEWVGDHAREPEPTPTAQRERYMEIPVGQCFAVWADDDDWAPCDRTVGHLKEGLPHDGRVMDGGESRISWTDEGVV